MSMTSRERVQAAVAHEEPDQAPCDDSFWEDCIARFHQEGMPQDVAPADYFDFDIGHIALDASPRVPEKLLDETADRITFVSKHGYSAVMWKCKSGALHYFDHVSQTPEGWDLVKKRMTLEIDGTARISAQSYFPPFTAYPTWEGAAHEYREVAATGRYVLMVFYGPFEATWRHHGYVQTLMDVAENPDLVAEMMGTFTDLVCATIRKGLDCGITPDGAYLAEDLGTTKGLIMSPAAFRRLIKPCYERIFTLARESGMARFMHSDGRIHAVLDDLVEVGLQALNPIDTGSGMDLVDLKKRYGKSLTLFGGVSARDMHEVARSNAQIDQKVAVAARGGGYIYHSDHSVPPTVSLARYKAILKRVREVTARRAGPVAPGG